MHYLSAPDEEDSKLTDLVSGSEDSAAFGTSSKVAAIVKGACSCFVGRPFTSFLASTPLLSPRHVTR